MSSSAVEPLTFDDLVAVLNGQQPLPLGGQLAYSLPLSQRQVKELVPLLQDHEGVRGLRLRACQLDDVAAAELSRVLAFNTVLRALDLRDNDIGDAGALFFSNALRTFNHTLLALDLSGEWAALPLRLGSPGQALAKTVLGIVARVPVHLRNDALLAAGRAEAATPTPAPRGSSLQATPPRSRARTRCKRLPCSSTATTLSTPAPPPPPRPPRTAGPWWVLAARPVQLLDGKIHVRWIECSCGPTVLLSDSLQSRANLCPARAQTLLPAQMRLQEVPPDTPAGRTHLTLSDAEVERRCVCEGSSVVLKLECCSRVGCEGGLRTSLG